MTADIDCRARTNQILSRMPAAAVAAARVPKAASGRNPLKSAVEIVKGRLYYVALKSKPSNNLFTRRSSDGKKKPIHFFDIDYELVYWNFFLDFGPLNLGQLYRFCCMLNEKLNTMKGHVVCFYSSTAPAKRANAIYLMCAWQVLYLDRTPENALRGFKSSDSTETEDDDDNNNKNNNNSKNNEECGDDNKMPTGIATTTSNVSTLNNSMDGSNSAAASTTSANAATTSTPKKTMTNASSPPASKRETITTSPLPPWHDASPCACTYDLTVLDCLKGLVKARIHGFIDFENFDLKEYEHFEQVENGDLNWIVKDKILAFAGPSYERHVSPEGYCTLAPSDYIPYFQEKNVALVVRLNKKAYNEEDFVNAGIDHLEQFYTDGSCPPMRILNRVLQAFEAVPPGKAFAVHCKAGLGRTGTCIGAYLMKHYRFTASEAIAWMRICRPGCVIGPQQHFLKEIEPKMWQLGSQLRPSLESIAPLSPILNPDAIDVTTTPVTDANPGTAAMVTPTTTPTKKDNNDADGDAIMEASNNDSNTPTSAPQSSLQRAAAALRATVVSTTRATGTATPLSQLEQQRQKEAAEAITGRAGQADALLSVRRGGARTTAIATNKRHGNNNNNNKSIDIPVNIARTTATAANKRNGNNNNNNKSIDIPVNIDFVMPDSTSATSSSSSPIQEPPSSATETTTITPTVIPSTPKQGQQKQQQQQQRRHQDNNLESPPSMVTIKTDPPALCAVDTPPKSKNSTKVFVTPDPPAGKAMEKDDNKSQSWFI